MTGIVVGVDGSPHSRSALEWALNESALRHAPLTVLAVSPVATNIHGLALESYPADEQNRAAVQRATEEFVDKAVASRAGQPPASVTVRAVTGLAADALISASQDADLLVVGARGVGGFTRLVLGSVSTQVTHHAHCPVVVVPGDRVA